MTPVEEVWLVVEGLFGLVFATGAASVVELIRERYRPRKKTTFRERVELMDKSLSDAIQLISELEAEIVGRQQQFAELERKIDLSSKVVKARKDEVEAAAQLMRIELQKEGHKSLRQNIVINVVFFLLGILAFYLITPK